jgi:hypothetical protein
MINISLTPRILSAKKLPAQFLSPEPTGPEENSGQFFSFSREQEGFELQEK